MRTDPSPQRHAARLVRLYPRSWRSRYEDEFLELMLAEVAERPMSMRRTLDVVRGAAAARASWLGLGGCTLDASQQLRASLVSLGVAVTVFVGFGASMWSQLTIGWQWERPDTFATTVATVVMSLAMLALLGITLLALAPLGWRLLAGLARRERRLLLPSLLFVGGAVVIFLGGRHFGNGWPGTGGHPWSAQGLVPGGIAAFSWASTLSVSSYWAHPAALAAFPRPELAWMAVSPLAYLATVVGAVMTFRRLELSGRVLRFETRLAAVACVLSGAFLCGALLWVVDGGPGPSNLYRAGAIDVVGTVMMGVALLVAAKAVTQAQRLRASMLPA